MGTLESEKNKNTVSFVLLGPQAHDPNPCAIKSELRKIRNCLPCTDIFTENH